MNCQGNKLRRQKDSLKDWFRSLLLPPHPFKVYWEFSSLDVILFILHGPAGAGHSLPPPGLVPLLQEGVQCSMLCLGPRTAWR